MGRRETPSVTGSLAFRGHAKSAHTHTVEDAEGRTLTDRHPEVRKIVLDGEALPLPETLRLSTSLYVARPIRVIGPTLALDLDTGGWEWVCELAYPPFAHQLRLAAADAPAPPSVYTGDLTT
jgi:hypothetical protein